MDPVHGCRSATTGTVTTLVAAMTCGAVLAGCTLSSEPTSPADGAGPDMQAVLDSAAAAHKNPVEVHPAWLYPGQPTGFFIVCPYLPRSDADRVGSLGGRGHGVIRNCGDLRHGGGKGFGHRLSSLAGLRAAAAPDGRGAAVPRCARATAARPRG